MKTQLEQAIGSQKTVLEQARAKVGLFEEPNRVAQMQDAEVLRLAQRFESARIQALSASAGALEWE